MSLMSWKSIELQVALPRVQDASKEQDLMSKQNQRFQEALTQSQLQEEIQKRKEVNKFDRLKKSNLTDEGKNPEENFLEKDKSKHKIKILEDKLEHPYLGSNIDLSR